MLPRPPEMQGCAPPAGARRLLVFGRRHAMREEIVDRRARRAMKIDAHRTQFGDRAHRLAHMVPMKRVGHADEIANAIVWLMSDVASYVTGATLDVSGGR